MWSVVTPDRTSTGSPAPTGRSGRHVVLADARPELKGKTASAELTLGDDPAPVNGSCCGGSTAGATEGNQREVATASAGSCCN
jgi:hypothetical protein